MTTKQNKTSLSNRAIHGLGILLLAGVTFIPVHTSADIVSGHQEFDFAGELSLWNASGSYSETVPIGAEGMVSLDITQDGKGKITGSGHASVDGIDIDFQIKGAMKGKGEVTTFKMKMKFRGRGEVQGESFTFRGAWKYAAEVDEANQRISGTLGGKLKVNVRGVGSETVALPGEAFDLDFPDGMDGSFTLAADFEANGNKISGSGSIMLANGEEILFSLKGKYKTKKDQNKVVFKSTSVKGAKLKMLLNGDGDVDSLKGKVLGQKLVM